MDQRNGISEGVPSTTSKLNRLQATDSDNELLELKVNVPDDDKIGFSWRKLWAFTGPGFLMSIAFLDPGNIQADLQSGAKYNYQLFWVLFWSTFLGLLVQRLSARVGTVTGQHMAEISHTEYRIVPRIFLWLMLEVAIIGSDMQEVIGTAISIYLLSSGKVPIWGGVLITVLDTLTFLLIDKYGLRKLELFFALLISIMAITFGYEFFYDLPDMVQVLEGTVIPKCTNCDIDKVTMAIGIVGSCIMPHNLYLHSGLVKTRKVDRSKDRSISEANFYFLIESALALFVSFIINLFVMAVFAKGVYGRTDQDVLKECLARGDPYGPALFHNDTNIADVDIQSGGVFLGCHFGIAALYIWAVGILAAGQSSTMTGCYAGQFVMEGFLNLTWVRWKRVLFTRSIAIIPSFWVAYYSDISSFNGMNDFLNALMSIQLPFAVIPAIAFTSNTRIVGKFANGVCQKIISVLIFVLIFSANTLLIVQFLETIEKKWLLILVYLYFILYLIVCIYLALHCIAALTDPDSWLNRNPLMRRWILGKSITEYYDQKYYVQNTARDIPTALFDTKRY